MNKKIIIIALLTLSAIVVLTLFSFGPLASLRKQTAMNPASLTPVPPPPAPVNAKRIFATTTDFKTYGNIDVKENYYQISVPSDWRIGAGGAPGGYKMSFTGGSAGIRLMDVPDNTTLELYVLSQEEPRLQKSVAGYKRLDYKKLTINGNEGYELVFTGKENQNTTETMTVYIAGQDHAGVITLAAPLDSFLNLQPIFEKIINSFNWKNK